LGPLLEDFDEMAKAFNPTVQYWQYLYNKEIGENNQALASLEEYIQLRDTIESNKYQEKIAEYEVKFNTQQKDIDLTKAKAKQRLILALCTILGLILIGVYTIYNRRLKHQQEMNAKDIQINLQKIQQLEKDNKLLALNSMIEGQEAERLRIAQDLHDGLGGLLTTVKAHFNSIQREIENIKNLNVYDKTNKLIDEACSEVRRIAHDMVPHSIKISGLNGALQDLKTQIQTRGFECDLEVIEQKPLNLSDQNANMIYRIIQEITHNAIKHSNGNKLFVQLISHDEGVNILVEDNGRGFDINNVMGSKGLGLKSIDSRVKYLNGKINYDSSTNNGTTVNIEIPMLQS
jgi:signal transduction histidine kinase